MIVESCSRASEGIAQSAIPCHNCGSQWSWVLSLRQDLTHVTFTRIGRPVAILAARYRDCHTTGWPHENHLATMALSQQTEQQEMIPFQTHCQ